MKFDIVSYELFDNKEINRGNCIHLSKTGCENLQYYNFHTI